MVPGEESTYYPEDKVAVSESGIWAMFLLGVAYF